MYINDVVSEVRRVLPGEYTTEEIYKWCDELSGDLRLNYCKKYCRAEIKPLNGCYCLPEGVTNECICSVIVNNKEIPKRDMRTYGYYHEYTRDGNVIVNVRDAVPEKLILNYVQPYKPIRIVDSVTTITGLEASDGMKRFSVAKPVNIKTGDVLVLKNGDSEYVINVLEMYYENDLQVIAYSGELILENGQSADYHIVRSVTETTECESPYDSMYVDFCTMKIAWYQRNFSVYGYMQKSFSDKLKDFEKYLRRNAASEEVTKIVNYMM